MLSIGKLGAAGGAEYYLDKVANSVDDYYLGRGEAPGRWIGKTAEVSGLAGTVDPRALRNLLAGPSPPGGAPGVLICVVDGPPVAFGLRPGQAALAVRGVAPAGDGRIPELAQPHGVFVPQQHENAAALARPEALRVAVVHLHFLLRQRPGLGEAHHLERIDAEIDTADDGRVDLPGTQRVARGGHRKQRGRAGAVHGEAAAAEVEVVADPARDRVRQAARQRVFVDRRERGLVALLELVEEDAELPVVPALLAQRRPDRTPDVWPAQPHEVGPAELPGQGVADDDAGLGFRQSFAAREVGILKRPGYGVQGQPVGHVRGPEGAPANPVFHPVELKALKHRGLTGVVPVRCGAIGGVVVVCR